MSNLTAASAQWASRPDDERFLSLELLAAAVKGRAERSAVEVQPNLQMQTAAAADGKGLLLSTVRGDGATPSHWAFGQLCSIAEAPAAWCRRVHPQMAALAVNYGLQFLTEREDTMILYRDPGNGAAPMVAAFTSPSYGRIWDHQVVEAVQRVNADGRWKVPAASYATQQPKRATTLYASDRDVFIFLVDPDHPVEVKRPDGSTETLFRGFYVWNSEVGKATFGLTTFLYRYVCDNRIIWGAEDVQELRIRHTSGGPERFAMEGARMLAAYAERSGKVEAERISRAMAFEVGRTDEDVSTWLRRQDFTLSEARAAIESAKREEGEARTLWALVNGGTALARGIEHADARIATEQRWSKLLRAAA